MTTALNKKKYQSAIVYLCQMLGGRVRGKKKLAKLLYFADFDLYEKNQKTITGDTYVKLPMGPFPSALEEITGEMVEANLLTILSEKERDGYIPTEVYTCTSDVDTSVLDDEERAMLDRVAVKYGHLTGKQLEDLSHAEAPYIGVELKQNIPYELAFYRGTDFSEV